MATISIKSFGGISPKVPPRYLPESQAQTALNASVFRGSLQPLANVGNTVLTLTKTGTPKTIYRFGQDTQSDTKYWFEWTQDVDVCRAQIPGDASEWTFYTGDGTPKATYNAIALSGTNYPSVSRPLGLQAPVSSLTASAGVFNATTSAAIVTLTASHISRLTTTYGIAFSLDEEVTYTAVTLTATDINAVRNALNDQTGISAEIKDTSIEVTTDAVGAAASLYLRFQTGVTSDTSGAFTYNTATLDIQDAGEADSDPYIIITDAEIGSISAGDKIFLSSEDAAHIDGTEAPSTFTASSFATWLTNALGGALTAVAYGSCVVVTRGTSGTGTGSLIRYRRQVGTTFVTTIEQTFSESADPARIFVTSTNLAAVDNTYISLLVNTTEHFLQVPDNPSIGYLAVLTAYGLSVTTFGAVDPIAVISTNAVGTSAAVRIRAGSYPTQAIYSTLSSAGSVSELDAEETRVYTWTWVNKESGFEFESAPAPASNEVSVRFGQSVLISGFESPPSGYVVTHKRLYRAVSGVFLFVTELVASEPSFIDLVEAADLGEELPSLTWTEPPADLKGLINLPNGLMAGFVGRDIYFCAPYRPHAWPLQYSQTVDFPVVGLGRLDTTLVVLTTGTPYFIQGTSPESMVVVRSDLEQACASKRSVVSFNGTVIYASPDGLVSLSPGGSKLVTEAFFTRDQWQSLLPASMYAYQNELKYICFYDTGVAQGCFVYDLSSGQFIVSSIFATAGYADLQRDKLFLAFSDRAVKVWGAGSALSYIWRSKKFTLPYPQGFSIAQVEAEAYPITAKFYLDGVLFHTQTVTSRTPFRLPAKVGRDLEVQIEGSTEVFSVDIAQSPAELRGV